MLLDLIERQIRLRTDRLEEERGHVAPGGLKAKNRPRRLAGEKKDVVVD